MRIRNRSIVHYFCVLLLGAAASAFAQGPLTPPGAPAPTMKSLDQLDTHVDAAAGSKRIAIVPGTPPIVLAAPGSYYLTSNLMGLSGANTIEIAADNVTLDLNGYTLLGVAGGKASIAVPAAHKNICIRGGFISGGVDGVNSAAAVSHNLTVESLVVESVSGAVWKVHGAGTNCAMQHVQVRNCGAGVDMQGLAGSVIADCTVVGASLTSSGTILNADRVERCSVFNSTGVGSVIGINGHLVQNCTIGTISGGGSAFQATGINGTTVLDCVVDTVLNAGSVAGISGFQISRCNATNINQTGAGSAACYGISSGSSVRQCEVRGVSGNTSGSTVGINGSSVADSFVLTVSNASSGSAFGFSVTTAAQRCVAANCLGGIDVNNGSAALITDCSLTGIAVVSALSFGIRTSSATLTSLSRVEGNVVLNFSPGISSRGKDIVMRNYVVDPFAFAYTFGASTMIGPIVAGPQTILSTIPSANFSQ